MHAGPRGCTPMQACPSGVYPSAGMLQWSVPKCRHTPVGCTPVQAYPSGVYPSAGMLQWGVPQCRHAPLGCTPVQACPIGVYPSAGMPQWGVPQCRHAPMGCTTDCELPLTRRRVGKTSAPEGEIVEMTQQMEQDLEERRAELLKVNIINHPWVLVPSDG